MAELDSQKKGLIHEHEVIRAEFRLLMASTGDLVPAKTASVGAWLGSRLDEIRSYQRRMRDLLYVAS